MSRESTQPMIHMTWNSEKYVVLEVTKTYSESRGERKNRETRIIAGGPTLFTDLGSIKSDLCNHTEGCDETQVKS